jgi:YidC/Oxa1 family membrane protein insertase
MLIAIALSLLFFIAYSTLMPKPQNQQVQQEQNVQQQQLQQSNIQNNQVAQNQQNTTATAPTQQNTAELVTVISKDFKLIIDNFGRITSKTLLAEKYKDDNGVQAQLVQVFTPKPLEMRFENQKVNQEAFSKNYTASVSNIDLTNKNSAKVILTQKLSDLTITKTVTFYQDGHYDLKIDLSSYQKYYLSNGIRPNPDPSDMSFTVSGAMVKTNSENIAIVEDEDADKSQYFRDVMFMSSFDKYYATVFYNLPKTVNVILEGDVHENPIMFIEGSQNLAINGYLGAKDYNTLHDLDPKLTSVIEYGWFTFMAEPLFIALKYIHDEVTNNWGWAIVILTILIKLLLYPLSYKGMMGMAKLKELAPQMKEIQRKYKGDPQRMSAKTMELYQKHGANPLGGCLPLLLQIPFFFAIYRVLLNSVELQGAEWIIWIDDLAKMDPYFILPILMGASMYYQQHVTPTNFTDPMQEKIFKFLPIIFTFFFLTFPAGLTLYWFVNNVLSVAQQMYINKVIAKQKTEKDTQKVELKK